jgi:uncharacterized protein YecE (DUF72 family)
MAKRSKVEAVRQPTLFEMEKPDKPAEPARNLKLERPYDLHPTILTGTSSFTAAGWLGTFYPQGTKPAESLSFYSTQFKTVEVDSTFYGTPAATTVEKWYKNTPPDFIFAAKVPQVITHEKVLKDCEAELAEFLVAMDGLGEKLGPLLFQFGKFTQWDFKDANVFLARLAPFLKLLPRDHRFAVEIRNRNWIDARFTELLGEYNVALALTDTSFVPRPWEMKEKVDLVTADFAYVRWLGNRKGIEEHTKVWDKPIVDRREDLKNWVEVFHSLTKNTKVLKIFAFANNHYAGHGPATVKLFWELWNKR